MNKHKAFLNKVKTVFYYTSTGMALGVLACLLLLFNVKFEMMVSQSLVMYIFTICGLVFGIVRTRIKKYLFFIVEATILLLALIGGKFPSLIYIIKEFINYGGPVRNIYLPSIVTILAINLINIYIASSQEKTNK